MTDWQDLAVCQSSPDPDVFFPLSEKDQTAMLAAKTVCAHCPVTAECLAFALERGLDYGVFGGHSPAERRALSQQQVTR